MASSASDVDGLAPAFICRNISTLAKKSNILKDITANADSMTMPTLDSYLNALKKLFVIEDVEAWCPAIRSATTIRSGKKREFTDPVPLRLPQWVLRRSIWSRT